jgi:hypothetical protein
MKTLKMQNDRKAIKEAVHAEMKQQGVEHYHIEWYLGKRFIRQAVVMSHKDPTICLMVIYVS